MTEAVSSLEKMRRGGNSFAGGRAAFILRVGTACHKDTTRWIPHFQVLQDQIKNGVNLSLLVYPFLGTFSNRTQ